MFLLRTAAFCLPPPQHAEFACHATPNPRPVGREPLRGRDAQHGQKSAGKSSHVAQRVPRISDGWDEVQDRTSPHEAGVLRLPIEKACNLRLRARCARPQCQRIAKAPLHEFHKQLVSFSLTGSIAMKYGSARRFVSWSRADARRG
jgi:hypothetical protein